VIAVVGVLADAYPDCGGLTDPPDKLCDPYYLQHALAIVQAGHDLLTLGLSMLVFCASAALILMVGRR
jgi:hypothetical protein